MKNKYTEPRYDDFAALEAAAQRAQEREDEKSLTEVRLFAENLRLRMIIARGQRITWKMVLVTWLAGAGMMYGLLAVVLGR